jgi:hypothetical protein
MGVAHFDDQPVQRGDVAQEAQITPGTEQLPVDAAELHDDSSEPRDVGSARGNSGCPRHSLEYAHPLLERHAHGWCAPAPGPPHARSRIRLRWPV